MASRNEQQSSARQSTEIKLWIHHEYYIPVNSQGECMGIVHEGALGYIIQIFSNNKYSFALKIPKLIGDTDRENIYINDLMQKEFCAVSEIIGGDNASSGGLLEAQITIGIRDPISIPDHHQAHHLDRSRVFVKYEKGKKPKFCLVKKDAEGESSSVFPPEVKCSMKEASFSRQFYAEINQKNQTQVLFLEFIKASEGIGDKLQFITIHDAEIRQSSRDIWCTCLPCVVYKWAPGTLQEVMSLNSHGQWTIKQHLNLIERLCVGLFTLHKRKMLHTDLRPANVIYSDSTDIKDPKQYVISDYGSFAINGSSNPFPPSEDTFSDNLTVLGPVVNGERSSPFYAPERKLGREREGANIAIIRNDDDCVFLILGWKKQLLDSDDKIKTGDIDKCIEEVFSDNNAQNKEGTLKKGDRIQAGEYIFLLDADERKIENKQILRCDKNIWKIYQNRITILTNIPQEFSSQSRFHYFSIPRTIELLQWSAATDIYSIGAIALYSVYTNYQSGVYDTKPEQTPINIEESFETMLNQLSSVPYFQIIWSELETWREQIEYYLDYATNPDSNITAKNFPQIEYKNNINEFRNIDFPSNPEVKYIDKREKRDQGKEPRNLWQATIRITTIIVQSVPRIEDIVRGMDYDLGRFNLFIHFVLCCLHRRDNLQQDADLTTETSIQPFAENRLEEAKEDGAAKKAHKRIENLIKFFNNNFLNTLKLEGEDKKIIPPYDPRTDAEIRLRYQEAKNEISGLNKKIEALKNKINENNNNKAEKILNKLHLLYKLHLFFDFPAQKIRKEIKELLNMPIQEEDV